MNVVFADTFYFIALLSEGDQAHERAAAATRAYSGRVVTTTAVLTEVADGLTAARGRGDFSRFLDRIGSRPDVTIVACDRELFEEGAVLFRRRIDKQWSLTDCMSFVVMQREGLINALTADHHFEQAGFVALLKS